eukprot:TRINITY_DN6010_c6_g1_i1.p3 TRINITY_DN6010_c6_g1~~TRINITY_DN6010_c6_g1_i1.p3  ORF type:complete len:109 (+),score=22.51 TRINITY_DN6010_c6_g1_i1:113-439(+)
MSAPGKDELACVYASIILSDEGSEVTPDALKAVIAAAGIRVQPIWLAKFSEFMAGRKVEDLVGNITVSSGGPGPAAAGGAVAAQAQVEAEPEPEPEEEDDDMGFSLFD